MMQAMTWQDGRLSIMSVPGPIPSGGESLVRVTRAGICNTDLEITKGYFGFQGVLGHEFVGVVETSDDPRWIGRRVTVDINCSCRTCATCREHNFHHCPNRTVIGIDRHQGAFAEFIAVPTRNLFAVPDTVTDEAAIFVEPLAAAFNILDQLTPRGSERFCVLGDGKLGLLIAMALASSGYAVTLVGRHPERRERLSFRGDLIYATELPDGKFDCVVEATGNAEGLQSAIALTRPEGTIVLKSTYADSIGFNPSMIVVNELKVIGSRCGPFATAIAALSDGAVDPTPLIDATYPLSGGINAMERAQSKGSLKVAITMPGDGGGADA